MTKVLEDPGEATLFKVNGYTFRGDDSAIWNLTSFVNFVNS